MTESNVEYHCVPRSLFGLPNVRIGLGVDMFTHMLIMCDRGGNHPTIILPGVNVDSGSKEAKVVALASGVYDILAAYHRLNQAGQYKAFYLMRTGFEADMHSLARAAGSMGRRMMPIVGGGSDEYLNFHRSGQNSDASQGCFTAPPQLFDAWRENVTNLERARFYHTHSPNTVNSESIRRLASFIAAQKRGLQR